MGAKYKSKTHLLNTVLDFLRSFLRVWLQSLKKLLIWPNCFFLIKKAKKNAEFHADFKSVEKVFKQCTKKSYKQNNWNNWWTWVKVEKVHISVTFSLITFLCAIKKKFSRDLKSAWNSAFFETYWSFDEKILLALISFFS